MTNNVLLFPLTKKDIPPQTIEEIERSAKSVKNARIEELCLDITDLILETLNENGVNISLVTEKQIKDVGMMIEATKSLVSRYYQQAHFLQPVTDQLFEETEDGVMLGEDVLINISAGKIKDDLN